MNLINLSKTIRKMSKKYGTAHVKIRRYKREKDIICVDWSPLIHSYEERKILSKKLAKECKHLVESNSAKVIIWID